MVKNGVAEHGALHVEGVNLADQQGRTVILRGMSSHGMQWYPEFARYDTIAATVPWGANLFRIAMYTEEDGYMSHPEKLRASVCAAADACIRLGIYAIIDWHILSDGNPQQNREAAKGFFAGISAKYGKYPNFIYEICNEPNGDVEWARDIRPYAEEMIPVIRKNAPGAVILVGTPTWSQDVDAASADPLAFDNVMYSCHFYAGTHGQELRDKILTARGRGCGVFISEWGTSAADGNGGVFVRESDVWLDFLETHEMGWANWSYGNRDETSAAVKPGADTRAGITEDCLTESGKYVFSKLREESGI